MSSLTRISLCEADKALVFLVVIAVLAGGLLGWRSVERAFSPSTRMPDLAYQASEECLREVASQKDPLLFAGFGFDLGGASWLRSDGNYESSGWVEQMDDYGRRHHETWRCVLHHVGEKGWRVVYLRVGNRTEGTDPQ